MEFAALIQERARVAAQLCEVRISEREIRQAMNGRKFDCLVQLFDKRKALESYLQQLESDIAGFRLEGGCRRPA